MLTLRPSDIVSRLEETEALDPIANSVRGVVQKVLASRKLRDLLHGVPLGHPLHPLMVQVPLGAWLSAAVLDAMPGTERAAKTLVGVGVLAAAPSAISGYADWSETSPAQQRVGVVHSTANAIAVLLYAVSWQQRAAERQGSGKFLSYAGLAVVSAGGFLGGHLAYRQRVGVDHSSDLPDLDGSGWQDLCGLEDLPENQPSRRDLNGSPLLVVRRGQAVFVLANACSHLAGPLNEGTLEEVDGTTCVVCPWHRSTFSLESGEVVHGPATAPQPRLRARVNNSMVQVAADTAS